MWGVNWHNPQGQLALWARPLHGLPPPAPRPPVNPPVVQPSGQPTADPAINRQSELPGASAAPSLQGPAPTGSTPQQLAQALRQRNIPWYAQGLGGGGGSQLWNLNQGR